MKTYKINLLMTSFAVLMFLISLENTRVAILNSNLYSIIFFVLTNFVILASICILFKVRIDLNPKNLVLHTQSTFNFPTRKFNWDDITNLTDDFYLFLHAYWITYDNPKSKKGYSHLFAISNLLIKDYVLLLRNFVTHMKPNSHVDESILTKVGMANNDIGRLYQKDEWINS